MRKTRLSVIGISGKMGNLIKELIESNPTLTLIGGINKANISQLDEYAKTSDALIDFSSPGILSKILETAIKNKKPLIIGTTGYSEGQLDQILFSSKKIPILRSANFSIGMAIFKNLIALASKNIDSHFEISEVHHEKKKDAPSGTALMLAETIHANTKKNPPIHSIRAKSIIGEHNVYMYLDEEKINLSHEVFNRLAFARGAIKAALFILNKGPGLYTIDNLF